MVWGFMCYFVKLANGKEMTLLTIYHQA